jgi:uncharacterized damage-inducible protein DinB
MEFKQYLIDTFNFNDKANKKVLEKIMQLPDKTEAINLFSHLINCQHRWMAGILQDPQAKKTTWWEPPYEVTELHTKWDDSLSLWIDYINSKTDKELSTEVNFIGFSGNDFAASPKDIALQLNYHSIHHRAQIQTIIRQQGLKPDSVEYINSHYRSLT